jgi:DUF2075 family protein
MHRFIREHGLEHPDRIASEHLIIFDEAQRAWDSQKVEDFYKTRLDPNLVNLRRSEPQLLVEAAERIPDWSLVLALVGDGQEIHVGEEAGIAQWADAVAGRGWFVHGPSSLTPIFAGHTYQAHPRLTLDTTLRAHAAADIHAWVANVLEGNFVEAAPLATRLREATFPIYVTRDLERARQYARDRFRGEPQRRYGLIASSRADRHLLRHGIDCGFQATKQIKIGPWYNEPPDSALSCCGLDIPITEFQAQGLELDLPIVCWGDDFSHDGARWNLRPGMRKGAFVHDPYRLRSNAYRVLLTRGREGLVIFVPPDAHMDATCEALVLSGAMSGDVGEKLRVA